jgi:hypothetical protein
MHTPYLRLKNSVAQLEEKYGPRDPLVKLIQEQLRDCSETMGMSTEAVFKMQKFSFAPDPSVPKPKRRTRR